MMIGVDLLFTVSRKKSKYPEDRYAREKELVAIRVRSWRIIGGGAVAYDLWKADGLWKL